ncbi:MAG: hypothetical protein OXP66_12095 [Candidatus Tectomicrobia bacterium]|nr:hypothetical protein [Candidatus Tectomicrobia bacterium]
MGVGESLHLAGGYAREGKDKAITFAVKLNRVAAHKVSVDYATADGTAVAGTDYTAVSGTLVFQPHETEKAVRVAILDDAVDEGKEDFFLQLTNPRGAHLGDKHREATGIIDNDDPLQKMWLSRFGRTVGTQAVEAIGARFAEGTRPSYLTLAGATLGGLAFEQDLDAGEHARLAAMTEWVGQQVGGETSQPQPRYASARDLLSGSSFRLSSNGEPDAARWSAWGRFASDAFDAEVDGVTLSGEVTTGFIGGDVAKGRWLAGLALGLSEGESPFDLTVRVPTSRGRGRVETDLRAAYPYVRLAVSERLDFWAVGGVGQGTMTIVEDGGGPLETDTRMHMLAVGGRGTLVGAARSAGFELALKSDLFFVRMQSDGLTGPLSALVATSAGVSRLRVLLQGSRTIALSAGGILRPSLELGLRHDGGDADTGSGVEAGARLAWTTAWGLTAEAAVHGLLAHQAAGYEEWGASASLLYDPGRGGLGVSASLTPAWGAASNGVERLWGQPTAHRLSAPDASESNTGRLATEVGYGIAALRGKGVLTPYLRAMLLEGDRQAWQLGTRLALAESLDLSLEASRRDGAAEDPEHAVALRAAYGW